MKAKIGSSTLDIERIDDRHLRIGNKTIEVDACQVSPQVYSLLIGGKSYQVTVSAQDEDIQVSVKGQTFHVQFTSPELSNLKTKTPKKQKAAISSPMPGRVLGIYVKKNQKVQKGDRLLILEAMKMENEFTSPVDGKVKSISVKDADIVQAGQELMTIE